MPSELAWSWVAKALTGIRDMQAMAITKIVFIGNINIVLLGFFLGISVFNHPF